ncbi:hypothetical protein ACPP0W_003509 [Vibrio alginolyticus]
MKMIETLDPKIMKTAKQWLSLPAKSKRYPRRGEVGVVGKKGTYFHIDQTIPVRSEATHHPFFEVKPVDDTYKGICYFYYDECEVKKTPLQWIKENNRRVIPNSVPCSVSRKGFNPETKESFEIFYFLKSDTVKLKGHR